MAGEEPYPGVRVESTPWLLLPSWPRCHGLGPGRKRLFTAWCLVLQSTKGREPACAPKDGKSLFSGLATGESSWSQHRQRRLQDHGKERKELFSMTLQVWLGLGVSRTPAGTPRSYMMESHGKWGGSVGPALNSLDFFCCVECGFAYLGLIARTLVVLFQNHLALQ